MSGRSDVDRVIHRLFEQGFSDDEIRSILQEADRRMITFGKAVDREWFKSITRIGLALIAIALGVVWLVGFPTHGRGVGIFYVAFIGGIAAVGYGVCGRIFKS